MLFYANKDKTKIVPEGDPEAQHTINADSPGEFEGLLKAHQDEQQAAQQKAQAEAKAQKPAEDKAARAPERK